MRGCGVQTKCSEAQQNGVRIRTVMRFYIFSFLNTRRIFFWGQIRYFCLLF